MALERLTLSPSVTDEDINKTPRLPRWTRQELLVLIQGKRVAENRVRRGRTTTSLSQAVVEPKWSSVSSYCKRHGVNRGPVQCRKRWSNLAGDFKKIKEWESQIKEEAESFWVMRNDLRRERKLPGFFDREVYDILDSGGPAPASLVLSLAPSEAKTEEVENEVVFDSGRIDDGLFGVEKDPSPISATRYESAVPPPPAAAPTATAADSPSNTLGDKEKETTNTDAERRKRKAADEEEEVSIQKQLIEAMERNGRLLSSQLEVQNINSRLDREQRNDHANSLFAVLNKLADAMGKIADKL